MDPLFSRISVNDAYSEPTQHLNLLRKSPSEDEVLSGRRPAGYYLGGRSEAAQEVSTREWRELVAVNKIRERVGRWRYAGYPGVTPVTKALLVCWARVDNAGTNLFFCQREAAETIIWLVEAPESDRAGLSEIAAPDPFLRYCLKMATGSGKTAVMAMLASWSVTNKVTNRGDARFSDGVLVVCPNLTVKERLQVLYPSHPNNEYDAKGLLPPGTDFKERLSQGVFQVSNWHQLAVQEDRPGRVLQRGVESDGAFCKRVLRDLGSKENLLVFNDEAHHAYRKNPEAEADASDSEEILETEDLEEFEREATVWVEGLDRVQRNRKIRLCVDLTATPYYIARSGYLDGTPFPWIVSDFGLVDAVESGIVKIPRVPRGDDSGQAEPRYLHLWEHIRQKLPKRGVEGDEAEQPLVKVLIEAEGALRSLGYLWQRTFESWKGKSEVPPCMIVVCNNTRTAELMANFIGSGFLEELRNSETEERTFRIDSALLRKAESEGDGGGDARAQALRKKVATVGKPGPPEEVPGGQIRCVVSVAMLSEGWDARNVTQVLGLRAFSSQLLCEQVVGRGLRRSSYDDLSQPEYVDIYGVPFQLLPIQRHSPGGEHKPATSVRALPDRADLEIQFPRVVGFFMDGGTELSVDEAGLEPIELTRSEEVGMVELGEGASYYGAGSTARRPDPTREEVAAPAVFGGERLQTTTYRISQQIIQEIPEEHRPYLFRRVLDVVRWYVETKVKTNGLPREMIALTRYRDEIVRRIRSAIRTKTGQSIRLPIHDPVQPLGSTRHVSFLTRKPTYPTTKSHVNHVVCDSARDDVPVERLWEYRVAKALDEHPAVLAFVKNDHLDFTITYTFQNEQARYVPDFLVRLVGLSGEERMLILEVKGEEDNRDRGKYTFARSWVESVNREGTHGVWAFELVRDPVEVLQVLGRVTTG